MMTSSMAIIGADRLFAGRGPDFADGWGGQDRIRFSPGNDYGWVGPERTCCGAAVATTTPFPEDRGGDRIHTLNSETMACTVIGTRTT